MSDQQQPTPTDRTTEGSVPSTSERPSGTGEQAPTTVDEFRALSQEELEEIMGRLQRREFA
jgi:hypothetical protein